jgi:hypothetical protein
MRRQHEAAPASCGAPASGMERLGRGAREGSEEEGGRGVQRSAAATDAHTASDGAGRQERARGEGWLLLECIRRGPGLHSLWADFYLRVMVMSF